MDLEMENTTLFAGLVDASLQQQQMHKLQHQQLPQVPVTPLGTVGLPMVPDSASSNSSSSNSFLLGEDQLDFDFLQDLVCKPGSLIAPASDATATAAAAAAATGALNFPVTGSELDRDDVFATEEEDTKPQQQQQQSPFKNFFQQQEVDEDYKPTSEGENDNDDDDNDDDYTGQQSHNKRKKKTVVGRAKVQGPSRHSPRVVSQAVVVAEEEYDENGQIEGWDQEVLEMSCMELNRYIKRHDFSSAQVSHLKALRRRLKNRVYASTARNRKRQNQRELVTRADQIAQTKEQLEAEVAKLRRELDVDRETILKLTQQVREAGLVPCV